MAGLRQHYREHVVGSLMKEFGYKSVMQVPRIVKVTLNMGIGNAVGDKEALQKGAADLTQIAGQKAIPTRARKAISNFKVRKDWPIGCKVTLRRTRMYQFLDRLITIAIPRIRDFRGLNPKSFDGRGNYSIGLTEQIIFPEIDYDKIEGIRGMDICITTSARDDREARAMFREMRFPIRN